MNMKPKDTWEPAWKGHVTGPFGKSRDRVGGMLNPPPGRHGRARSGALLIASSWISILIILGLYLALKPAQEAQRDGLVQLDRGYARMISLKGCVCPDTPLGEINEPNVFPGPSNSAPDTPHKKPLKQVSDECCGELTPEEMHKTFEIGEANVPKWKEYKTPYNVFPGMIDWDPDTPHRAEKMPAEKEMFDGHGGIIGLEDTHAKDPWKLTPGSAGPDVFNEYTDGSDGKDYNVFANGYKFPHY